MTPEVDKSRSERNGQRMLMILKCRNKKRICPSVWNALPETLNHRGSLQLWRIISSIFWLGDQTFRTIMKPKTNRSDNINIRRKRPMRRKHRVRKSRCSNLFYSVLGLKASSYDLRSAPKREEWYGSFGNRDLHKSRMIIPSLSTYFLLPPGW